jgi:hypothetical protein
MPTAKTLAFPRMWVNSTRSTSPGLALRHRRGTWSASQRLDEAYRRLVAAGGVPSQDLSTIYGDVPDQDEGDHDGEY